MSLITPAMPPDIIRAFTTGLGDFVSPNDPLWSVMLEKFFALEQYNLNLDAFTKEPAGPLEDITNPSGWRFLAADGDLYGGCHVGSVHEGLPPKVTGFSRDVQVLSAIESFNELNMIEEVKQDPFEPRVLRVAWLRFEAYWLKFSPARPQQVNAQAGNEIVSRDRNRDQDDDNDLVIPYIGFVEMPPKRFDHDMQLQRMTAYTVADFLRAVGSRRPAPRPSRRRQSDVLPPGGIRPKVQVRRND